MSRTPPDAAYRTAFAARLRTVLEALDARLADVSSAMGYQGVSTLRAALLGRSNIDPSKLERLARWCDDQGHALDLHWLLTGDGSAWRTERGHAPSPWLTPKRQEAIEVLAAGIPSRHHAVLKRP